MISKFKLRSISSMVLIAVLPLLTSCSDADFQSFIPPSSIDITPPPSPPPASVVPGTVLGVDSLEKGQCADTIDDARLLDDVTIRDCNGPHEFEVSGLITRPEIAGLDFPGRIGLVSKAQLECEAMFEDYTGTGYFDSTIHDLDTITPSAETWADGDRTIICLVVGVNGALLTQSAA